MSTVRLIVGLLAVVGLLIAGIANAEENKPFPGHPSNPDGLEVNMQEIDGFKYIYLEGTGVEGIPETFQNIAKIAEENSLFNEKTGVYSIFDTNVMGGEFDAEGFKYHAAISVEKDPKIEGVMFGEIPAGLYMVVVHKGPYGETGMTYEKLIKWSMENKVPFGEGMMFEKYLNDPETTPEEELLTEIYIPFKHMKINKE